MTRTRSIKAGLYEWEKWARAADGKPFNRWAREILNAAADAWIAADARIADERRQRELLKGAIRQ